MRRRKVIAVEAFEDGTDIAIGESSHRGHDEQTKDGGNDVVVLARAKSYVLAVFDHNRKNVSNHPTTPLFRGSDGFLLATGIATVHQTRFQIHKRNNGYRG